MKPIPLLEKNLQFSIPKSNPHISISNFENDDYRF